jgi:membrane-associated protease RseP (regulator of RpoE activity)
MSEFLYQKTNSLAGRNYPVHIALFVITLLTTTWAGAIWTGQPPSLKSTEVFFDSLATGVPFALAILAFLTVHEFGHFFATLKHGLRATLPYYIPLPPLPFLLSIGTLGAIIRIKEPITSRRTLFDIGATGPLAGFVIALGLLIYGFLNLPATAHISSIQHGPPATEAIPANPDGTLLLGKNLLYILLETLLVPQNPPPMTGISHNPYLFAGWLGCFVTALNLLPVGQLDGGHIIYAMFGQEKHRKITRIFLIFITLLGAPSFTAALQELFLPSFPVTIPAELLFWSWPGWIIWAFILERFLGSQHPHTGYDYRISPARMGAGWACIVIFILTFTPVPFRIL